MIVIYFYYVYSYVPLAILFLKRKKNKNVVLLSFTFLRASSPTQSSQTEGSLKNQSIVGVVWQPIQPFLLFCFVKKKKKKRLDSLFLYAFSLRDYTKHTSPYVCISKCRHARAAWQCIYRPCYDSATNAPVSLSVGRKMYKRRYKKKERERKSVCVYSFRFLLFIFFFFLCVIWPGPKREEYKKRKKKTGIFLFYFFFFSPVLFRLFFSFKVRSRCSCFGTGVCIAGIISKCVHACGCVPCVCQPVYLWYCRLCPV